MTARLQIFTRATSLGGPESLIEHRASIEGPRTTRTGEPAARLGRPRAPRGPDRGPGAGARVDRRAAGGGRQAAGGGERCNGQRSTNRCAMPIRHAPVVVLFASLVTAALPPRPSRSRSALSKPALLRVPRLSQRCSWVRASTTGPCLNPAFDYMRYFETLKRDGLNVTRLFVGTYLERQGDFGIAFNDLAPAPGTALLPWARSASPGSSSAATSSICRVGTKRTSHASGTSSQSADAAGVVVEVTLFSAYYGNRYSPVVRRPTT